MQNLFNYTTLSTRLEKTTRTLFVTLNRPDWSNSFRLEMLFELESLLAWCTARVEINTIFIDSSSAFFSTGHDLEKLPSMTASQLEKINIKIHKIIYSMMQLPQTVIIDLKQGCETLASEFALGADIRICSNNSQIRFNHNQYGLLPGAGGMNMLSVLVSPVYARNWILSGATINQQQLVDSGFIAQVYDDHNRDEVITQLLTQIAKQAPVQRIQSKLGLFEALRAQFEAGIITDRRISKASMISEDWKTKKAEQQEDNFMPAKSMSYSVKLSLIKNEERSGIDH